MRWIFYEIRIDTFASQIWNWYGNRDFPGNLCYIPIIVNCVIRIRWAFVDPRILSDWSSIRSNFSSIWISRILRSRKLTKVGLWKQCRDTFDEISILMVYLAWLFIFSPNFETDHPIYKIDDENSPSSSRYSFNLPWNGIPQPDIRLIIVSKTLLSPFHSFHLHTVTREDFDLGN